MAQLVYREFHVSGIGGETMNKFRKIQKYLSAEKGKKISQGELFKMAVSSLEREQALEIKAGWNKIKDELELEG